jgi:hypothetical protein
LLWAAATASLVLGASGSSSMGKAERDTHQRRGLAAIVRRTTLTKVGGRVESSSSLTSSSESTHCNSLDRPKEAVVGWKGHAVGERRRGEDKEPEVEMVGTHTPRGRTSLVWLTYGQVPEDERMGVVEGLLRCRGGRSRRTRRRPVWQRAAATAMVMEQRAWWSSISSNEWR